MDEFEKFILGELEKIRADREKAVATLNALNGAESAFTNMLNVIKEKENKEKEVSENECN